MFKTLFPMFPSLFLELPKTHTNSKGGMYSNFQGEGAIFFEENEFFVIVATMR